MAVVAEQLDVCPPCGGCRQRLAEFGGPDTPVYLGRPGGARQTFTVGELLPLAFELEPRSELREAAARAHRARRVRAAGGRGARLRARRGGGRRAGPRRDRLRGAARLPAAERRRDTAEAPCSAASAACRWRCCRAARTCTRAATSTACATPVRALRAAGAEVLVLTNAAGSLRPELGPGRLMLISDHINMSGVNVLDRPERRRGRPALPEPARRLRPGAARRPARRRGRARASSSARASTSP